MSLKFRNLDVTPEDPVDEWGVDGILTAMERGGLNHVHRIVHAMREDPHGVVAQDLEEAVGLTDNPVGQIMLDILAELRESPNQQVARRVRKAIDISGVSLREFAKTLGTSASRLSTYATGKVMPSAAMFLRIEELSRRLTRGIDIMPSRHIPDD